LPEHIIHNLASPKERRGGDRSNHEDEDIALSITEHIQKYKAKKSHYSRADTGRYYLQPELSIKLMYNHWKTEMINNNKKNCII